MRGEYPWPVGQRRYRGRKLPRYKKTGIAIALTGVALGVAGVILWPQLKTLFQTPLITVALGARVGNQVWNGTAWVTALTDEEIDFVNTLPYDRLTTG